MGGGLTSWLEGNNSTFDAGGMSDMNMQARSQERNAVTAAESQVNQFGLKAMADIASAGYAAEAAKAQGAAKGQAAIGQGISGLASGLAGGISPGMFGGGSGGVTGTEGGFFSGTGGSWFS